MLSIQKIFNASTSAIYLTSGTRVKQYSFRISKDRDNDIVFGPAKWSASNSIEHRLWLKNNGFTMEEVDNLCKILSLGALSKKNIDFVNYMNKKLSKKRMYLEIDQKKWYAKELNRIKQIAGLEFINATDLISSLVMFHDLQSPIKDGCPFHARWKDISLSKEGPYATFLSEFFHWKLTTDSKCKKSRDGCIKSYGIIVDKINN